MTRMIGHVGALMILVLGVSASDYFGVRMPVRAGVAWRF